MDNAKAIIRFEQLHIKALRKELVDDEYDEFLNLQMLMVAGMRSCKICKKSDDQGSFIDIHGRWAHIDCAVEHHQACQVDPTTMKIDETEQEYALRMRLLGL